MNIGAAAVLPTTGPVRTGSVRIEPTVRQLRCECKQMYESVFDMLNVL